MTRSIKNRWNRGWGIVKNSMLVISTAKALLLVPVTAFLINLALLIALMKYGLQTKLSGSLDSWGFYPHYTAWTIVWFLLYYIVATEANVYMAGVVSHNVLTRFDGRPVSIAASLRAAWKKRASLLSF